MVNKHYLENKEPGSDVFCRAVHDLRLELYGKAIYPFTIVIVCIDNGAEPAIRSVERQRPKARKNSFSKMTKRALSSVFNRHMGSTKDYGHI